MITHRKGFACLSPMLLVAGALSLALGASKPTQAQSLEDPIKDFCTSGSCSEISLINAASVNVYSITITQENVKGDCAKDQRRVTRTILAQPIDSEDSVLIRFDRSCQYKIKFKTSNGCTGDKTGHIKLKDHDTISAVRLRGACGSLKVDRK